MKIWFILLLFFSSLDALSQSAAFLQLESYEKIAAKHPYITTYKDWIDQIVSQEAELENDYFVLYHACKGCSLFQDVLRILLKNEEFIYLRTPWKEIYSIENRDDYFKSFGVPSLPDRPQEVKKQWLTLCLELLDNHIDLEKMTEKDLSNLHAILFKMWLKVDPSPHDIDFIQHFFPSYEQFFKDFSENVGFIGKATRESQRKMFELEQAYGEIADAKCRSFQQHLLAVNLTLFGNYDSLGDCTLEYWHSGRNHIPIENDRLILEILEHFQLDPRLMAKLNESYAPIRAKDQVIFAIYVPKTLINEVLYFSYGFYEPIENELSPHALLTAYQTKMKSIENYKTLQGRLVFNRKYLLNPSSGIKIKRYHQIDEALYSTYFNSLKNILVPLKP